MKNQYDFKKEWPRLKNQLTQLSKEAMRMAKKGEKEIVRFSKKGKLHVDSTALGLKREHLVHRIGKEYVKADCPGPHTPTLQRLISELKKVDRDMESLKKRIKKKKVVSKKVVKKTVKKKPRSA